MFSCFILRVSLSSPDNPEHNTMSDRKAVIKNADMGEEMQQDAVDCATQALEKYNIEKVIIKDVAQIHVLPSVNHLLRLPVTPAPIPCVCLARPPD